MKGSRNILNYRLFSIIHASDDFDIVNVNNRSSVNRLPAGRCSHTSVRSFVFVVDVLRNRNSRSRFRSQEMVNLFLGGRARSNVFNDTIRLDEDSETATLLKGVDGRSDIGLLSLFEYYRSCQVTSVVLTPTWSAPTTDITARYTPSWDSILSSIFYCPSSFIFHPLSSIYSPLPRSDLPVLASQKVHPKQKPVQTKKQSLIYRSRC